MAEILAKSIIGNSQPVNKGLDERANVCSIEDIFPILAADSPSK